MSLVKGLKNGVYMTIQDLKELGVLAVIPTLGGAAANLAATIATRFGHTFLVGSQSALLIGTIGAVSNLASIVLSFILDSDHSMKRIAAIHVIVPVALSGIIAAAAYMSIIAARLSLLGTILLISTTIVGNLAWHKGLIVFNIK
jgi:hypothetical protein